MKSLIAGILVLFSLSSFAQVSSFDEMEFEMDSTTSTYKANGKNFILIKSKRGTSGVNKTPQADAVLAAEITEIVLVYSETEPSDIAEREEANRERWENLLMTYPELFQFSTTYKNLCQCKTNGDVEAFKKAQGFYVYVNGEVPKAEETKEVVAAPVIATTLKPSPPETLPPAAKTTNAEVAPPVTNETKAPIKEAVAVGTAAAAVATPAKVIPAKEVEKENTQEAPMVSPAEEETPVVDKTAVAKAPLKKKPVVAAKPRKAKDPKACRPACYGYGDEDLQQFFKDNIPLSKKQKRKAKNWVAQVRLQINLDGTIKKAMVTSTEEAFKVQVEEIIKSMNTWNAAVKNGTTVKSEVRFTLKFDKDAKCMKPFDIITNPKSSPRCPCISDGEMFD
jgi:hypothetical protein